MYISRLFLYRCGLEDNLLLTSIINVFADKLGAGFFYLNRLLGSKCTLPVFPAQNWYFQMNPEACLPRKPLLIMTFIETFINAYYVSYKLQSVFLWAEIGIYTDNLYQLVFTQIICTNWYLYQFQSTEKQTEVCNLNVHNMQCNLTKLNNFHIILLVF